MDAAQLMDRFRRLAEEISERELPEVTPSTAIAELGMDSLSMLELVGELERDLGIHIPSEDVNGIESVGQLLTVVADRLGSPP